MHRWGLNYSKELWCCGLFLWWWHECWERFPTSNPRAFHHHNHVALDDIVVHLQQVSVFLCRFHSTSTLIYSLLFSRSANDSFRRWWPWYGPRTKNSIWDAIRYGRMLCWRYGGDYGLLQGLHQLMLPLLRLTGSANCCVQLCVSSVFWRVTRNGAAITAVVDGAIGIVVIYFG